MKTLAKNSIALLVLLVKSSHTFTRQAAHALILASALTTGLICGPHPFAIAAEPASSTGALVTSAAATPPPTAAAAAATPPAPAQSPYEKACAELAARQFPSSEEKLSAVFDFQWNHLMETFPEWATSVGDPRGQDSFTDLSPEALAARKREAQCPLTLIKSIDAASLKAPADRLNHSLFTREAERSIEDQKFPDEFFAVSQLGGAHTALPELLQNMRHENVKDFENAIARLEKTPAHLKQVEALLREGLAKKLTPPRATLANVPAQFEQLLETRTDKNPLFAIFKEIPASIPAADADTLKGRAAKVLRDSVIPALRSHRRFLEQVYIPGARESIAWAELPNGTEWYDARIREYTTTNLSAQEIHNIGVKETARIKSEMLKVMKDSGWKKDLPAFFEFLRKDSRFFFKTSDELLAAYRDIAKRLDPELFRFFGKLPRMPYGVKAVPSYSAKSAPTGYYEGGSLKAGRPGWFIANTYDLKSRPKWEMEPLTAHEAVPGHHIQISLAEELENVPEFRRSGYYGAFMEGWGLYAESLGAELGLYKDPYAKMGQLTYQMWRANRLVVDTGIHAFGWSRQKAIDFMATHMPKALHDIEVEVDRYIVNPGQALTYKIGELKIRELRTRAEKKLGPRFDIRAFHDALLADGTLPLDILEKKMDEWIDKQAQSTQ